jgi:hypothetical protein
MKTKTPAKKNAFRNYWQSHNIPKKIGVYAESLGLACVSTGGGYDYVYREFPCGAEAILSSSCETGCPNDLKEPSTVTVYQVHDPDESTWRTGVEYGFKDARSAMRWMKDMNPVQSYPETGNNLLVSEQQRLAEMFRKKHEKTKSQADWVKYIKGMGMKLMPLDIKKNTLNARDFLLDIVYKGLVGDGIVVDNPGHGRGYIIVPRDLALKILVLEGLP